MDLWPIDRFPVTELQWRLGPPATLSGATLVTPPRVTRLDGGGWWQAAFGETLLWDSEDFDAWFQMEAIADGGAAVFTVPMILDPALQTLHTVPHSDGSTFSDGSGYVTPITSALLSEDAARRAPELIIEVDGPLRRHFSIEHPTWGHRAYRIMRQWDLGGGVWRIQTSPLLREAAAAGTLLNFDRPLNTMRVTNSETMSPLIGEGWTARPTVSFVEAYRPSV